MAGIHDGQATFGNNVDHENVYRLFYMFLNEFTLRAADGSEVFIYRVERDNMIAQKKTTLVVNFKHLQDTNSELNEAINLEYYR